MELKTFKSDFILLITATIWGFAFVAQRMGMDHVGPFTYNGARFILGGLSLLPFLLIGLKKKKSRIKMVDEPDLNEILRGGILSGLILFAGSSFQQIGLVYTTAGKAGFITGLYVIIVPVIGLIWKQRAGTGTWIGAFMAALGLYLLSVTEQLTISFGDVLELVGAVFFALHVIVIGRLCQRIDTVSLSFVQCFFCSIVSMAVAFLFENVSLSGIWLAAFPIFYGGVFSVGIAYSLQIYGQKGSHPAHAAILMSLESVIAAIGGWLILNEFLSGRALTGCVLMMSGMLVSQLYTYLIPQKKENQA